MSYSFERKLLLWNNFNEDSVILRYTGITKEEIVEYAQEHPMPQDPLYSMDDLLNDLNGYDSAWTLPESTSEQMLDWLEDMVNELT